MSQSPESYLNDARYTLDAAARIEVLHHMGLASLKATDPMMVDAAGKVIAIAGRVEKRLPGLPDDEEIATAIRETKAETYERMWNGELWRLDPGERVSMLAFLEDRAGRPLALNPETA